MSRKDDEDNDSIDHSHYAPLDGNELLRKFRATPLPRNFHRLLDPELDDHQRGDWFALQANDCAWAIPDERALAVCQSYAPLVEMGAGAGYWARLLREQQCTIDAYDKRTGTECLQGGEPQQPYTKIEAGGPEVLSKYPNATLLLIYPDDHEAYENELSLSVASLQHFLGDTVIHVGEWLGSTLTVTMEGQETPEIPYPWGRSTSPDFQIVLEASFHKILQIALPSVGHVRNCLTVWKRNQSVVLEGDRYAYIPLEERLQLDMCAPATRHLMEYANETNTEMK